MTKEQIHDSRISPLMAEIINLCKERGIAMLASYALGDTEEGTDCICTTHLPDETGATHPKLLAGFREIRPQARPVMHVRTRHTDGSQTLTAIVG